jgi:hypothetical protein
MLIYFMAIWKILMTFGIFYDHFVDFVLVWYIFPVLVSCTKKNLATLLIAHDIFFIIPGRRFRSPSHVCAGFRFRNGFRNFRLRGCGSHFRCRSGVRSRNLDDGCSARSSWPRRLDSRRTRRHNLDVRNRYAFQLSILYRY